VKQACARALNDLYANCLYGLTVEEKLSIIVDPLASFLLGGTDKHSQECAAICLYEFVLHPMNNGPDARDIQLELATRFIPLFLVAALPFSHSFPLESPS
jgi:hypothetical protein